LINSSQRRLDREIGFISKKPEPSLKLAVVCSVRHVAAQMLWRECDPQIPAKPEAAEVVLIGTLTKRDYKPSWTGALVATSAAMGAMALYNIHRTRKVEREHPPTGRFVTVDGVKLHYVERGRGPPVILLHGNIVSSADFDLSGVLDLIAGRHRVIAFDRPGFGYSDRPHGSAWSPAAQADLLQHAFAALGIEHPVVLGHSYGAAVALELALNHPNAVSGLVLLSGYYYPTLRADVLLSLPGEIPIISGVMRYTVSPLWGAALLPRLIKGMFAPLRVPRRFARGFASGLSVRPRQIRAESQDSVTMVPAAATMRRRYGELSMPVVIMAGSEDRVVHVARHAIRLHHDVPHSTLLLVPDVGHMIHHAVPEQIAEAVESTANRSAGTSTTRLTLDDPPVKPKQNRG
jgi:pimeloyl-ACP methyl ester carboxylesterase